VVCHTHTSPVDTTKLRHYRNLNDVYCISADTVVVVGNNGIILRTTDGGTNWLPVSNPASANLHQVAFADTQTGYAVGDNGTLLKTTDAGVSWQSLTTNTTENLLAISVVSADTIYTGGTNGLIMKTTDGGNSLNQGSLSGIDNIIDIQYIDPNTIYGLGYVDTSLQNEYYFMKTTNGGNSWNNQNTNLYYGTKISFSDIDTGFIISSELKITNNGGNSFSSFPTPEPICSNDIFMFDETDFWLTGWDCRVSNSTARGFIAKYNNNPNFNNYNVFYGANFYNAIHFANHTTGYVVGETGAILKNSTGNMGVKNIEKEFFSIYPNPAENLITINFKTKIDTRVIIYKIYNLQGQLILENNLSPDKHIDVSNLLSGIYLIKLTINKQFYIQKLIIKK